MSGTRPIVLVYAPPSDPTQSYTSLPSLTGFLRARGWPVIQRDLGIEILDGLLTPAHLRTAWQRAKQRSAATRDPEYLARFHRAALSADYVIQNAAKAKAVLRDRTAFYDLDRYHCATNVVGLATELASLPHHPSQLTPASYIQDIDLTPSGLLAAAEDRTANVFIDLFDHKIVDEILAADPLLVGISATYHFQVVAAFTLARLLKIRSPRLPVVVGGAIISRMESHLLTDPRMFRWVDHFVVGEGESALLHLATAIAAGDPPELAPNQISLVDGRPAASDTSYVETVQTLAPLDFEGLDLELYLSPEPVLLLPTSRGCYWGKCTFCDVSRQTRQVYRPVSRSAVCREMLALRDRYGAKRFFFCDDAVPLGTMREISTMIADAFPEATWQAEVRLEKGFTREFIEVLHRGGCRQLMFGFESSSQRVLDRMLKNNTHERDLEIIHDCADVGIALNLQTFIGLPTEEREEAETTIEFLLRNERYLSSIGFGVFSLWKETPIYNEPEKHGITAISIPLRNSLLSECEFETTSGMPRSEAFEVFDAAMARIEPIFRTRSHFLGGASGSHSLLHLSEYTFTELRDDWARRDRPLDPSAFAHSRPRVPHDIACDASPPHTCFVPKTADVFELTPEDYELLERCRSAAAVEDVLEEGVTSVAVYARRAATLEAMARRHIVEFEAAPAVAVLA